MEYLDFELRIGAATGAGPAATYPVTVLRSPAGEVSAMARFPLDDPAFKRHLQVIEHVRSTAVRTGRVGEARRDVVPVGAAPGSAGPVDDVGAMEAIGRALFDELFTAKVLSCYRRSLDQTGKAARLRVRLRIDAPEMAALPWELLFDAEAGDFIAPNQRTPMNRYLELASPVELMTIPPPIRILGMAASPRDRDPLDVAREKQGMAAAVDHLVDRGIVELAWVEGQTWRDLETFLQGSGREWHIFHFIGHGGFDRERGEGMIALTDESGGSHFVSAQELARTLDRHPSIRLAVLNACEGARASEADSFSSSGTVLVQRGIPAVISMQYEITDAAATEFARNFYDALARKLPVDAAVTEARYYLSMTPKYAREWGTPVLHMHARDGSLFVLDEGGGIFPEGAGDQSKHLRGDRGTTSGPPPPSPGPVASETLRGLQILRRKVEQFWIEGVLENSLFQQVLIDLGMERMAGAVDSWASSMLDRPGLASEPIPADQRIADVFAEVGSSLLILGEPGSGKTTTMLGLARTLVARAERELGDPIPVVFNLSSWVEPHRTIADWMVDELSGKYQIPRKIGRAWLAESRIIPLLDGLDELQAVRRAACVEAVNAFTADAGMFGVVVCCRLREYTELPVRFGLNAAVRLQQLTDEQVEAYLTAAGDRLSALHSTLKRDSAMRIDARSPLMLSLMARAFQDLSVNEVLREGMETTALRRKQLMDAYVERMFRQAGLGRVV